MIAIFVKEGDLMSSESKKFCVFDPKSNDLICMECSIKNSVDQIKLKEFFDQLYAVRMDSSYCYGGKKEFRKGENIVSLRDEFKKMIDDPETLNFEGIYHLFDGDEQRQSIKLAHIISQFMSLFSFQVLERYTSNYMLPVVEALGSSCSDFLKENFTFSVQCRDAYYNTKMMVLSNFPLGYIIPKEENKKYYK